MESFRDEEAAASGEASTDRSDRSSVMMMVKRSSSMDFADKMTSPSRAKGVVSFVMHYTMFFLCYGASRAICQPWMWKLHFWLVVCAAVLTLVLTIIFVCMIAPMIPNFAASLSLPPYMDKHNLVKLGEIAEEDTTTAADYMRSEESPD